MKSFITTQLYDDPMWRASLENGFDIKNERGGLADRLRPLILEGMRLENEEVDAIVGQREKPTFQNTIVAFSKTGKELDRATTLMYNLQLACTSNKLDKLANDMAAPLTAHANQIKFNARLFKRVKTVKENETGKLLPEEQTLLDRVYDSFVRSGALLDAAKKKTYGELTARLAKATLRFSQNLLKDTHNYILHLTSERDLAGLPEIHRNAAAEEAARHGLQGWVFTLEAPSYVPFMMYADSRSLREKLYRAYSTRCTHGDALDNSSVVREIVNLRLEIAQLLGYANYADFALCQRMAGTSAEVFKLLNQLIERYKPQAVREVSDVEAKARELAGSDFQLQPWDFSYYSQKLKKERFDYDPDMLRPYLELSQVKKGVFGLANKLYGITLKRDKKMPTYHADVEAYRVSDREGQFLAVLLVDFFPRKNKQGGAWMTNYREEYADVPVSQSVTPENSFRPVVSVTTNFTKPTSSTPALLTLGEVETFLHEFGHALHGIFAMTHFEALSGTSVKWDFVELPSQFMENYATEPEFLHTFAFHYQTGEPIPEQYIRRVQQSRTFLAAYACMRQVAFGLLDMAFYTSEQPLTGSVIDFERCAMRPAQLLPTVDGACMATQFEHIMAGGYAAGYYSYKWAEVLDADAFSLFQEKGIFNAAVADSFRQNILSRGGTEAPMTLYERFRGRKPTIEALLHRDGIQ